MKLEYAVTQAWCSQDLQKGKTGGGQRQRLKLCCLLSFCLILSKTIKKSNDVWITSTFVAGSFGVRSYQNSICHFRNHHNDMNIYCLPRVLMQNDMTILVCWSKFGPFSIGLMLSLMASSMQRRNSTDTSCSCNGALSTRSSWRVEVVTGSDLRSRWRYLTSFIHFFEVYVSVHTHTHQIWLYMFVAQHSMQIAWYCWKSTSHFLRFLWPLCSLLSLD